MWVPQAVLLKLLRLMGLLAAGELEKMCILSQAVRGQAGRPAFITNSQVVPMLLVHGLNLE